MWPLTKSYQVTSEVIHRKILISTNISIEIVHCTHVELLSPISIWYSPYLVVELQENVPSKHLHTNLRSHSMPMSPANILAGNTLTLNMDITFI